MAIGVVFVFANADTDGRFQDIAPIGVQVLWARVASRLGSCTDALGNFAR